VREGVAHNSCQLTSQQLTVMAECWL